MGNVTIGLSLDARRFSRRLRRSPWFALTTAVMLGGVFAIVGVTFALADGVLFKALPFRAAEELYIVQPAGSHASEPKSLPVRGDVVAAWFSDVHDAALTAINVAPRLFVKADGRDYFMAGIDEHFFDVIGVSPLMGGFTPDDFDSTNPAALPPAVISYRLWRSMFGQDENILGRSVVLLETKNRQAGVRVAGVLGPDFVFPTEPGEASPDVLTPLSRRAIAGSKRPTFRVIARLAPEVSVAGVGEQLRRAMIDAELVLKSSNEPRLDRLSLEPLQQHLGSTVRGVVTFIVLGAILLMLLLCGNLAALAARSWHFAGTMYGGHRGGSDCRRADASCVAVDYAYAAAAHRALEGSSD